MSEQIDSTAQRVSLFELVLTFNHIALASFGGGLSAWSREVLVVEKGWLGDAEFLLPGRDGVIVQLGGIHRVAGRLHVADPLVAAHAAFVENDIDLLPGGAGERGGSGESEDGGF